MDSSLINRVSPFINNDSSDAESEEHYSSSNFKQASTTLYVPPTSSESESGEESVYPPPFSIEAGTSKSSDAINASVIRDSFEDASNDPASDQSIVKDSFDERMSASHAGSVSAVQPTELMTSKNSSAVCYSNLFANEVSRGSAEDQDSDSGEDSILALRNECRREREMQKSTVLAFKAPRESLAGRVLSEDDESEESRTESSENDDQSGHASANETDGKDEAPRESLAGRVSSEDEAESDEGRSAESSEDNQSRNASTQETDGINDAYKPRVSQESGHRGSGALADQLDGLSKAELKAKLLKYQGIKEKTRVQALPDKGQKLNDLILSIKLQLADLSPSDEDQEQDSSNHSGHRSNNSVTILDDSPGSHTFPVRAGMGEPKPGPSTGRVGGTIFLPEPLPAPLRPEVLEKMYAAGDNVGKRLMGGQMNDKKLREARNVTVESIEGIHESLRTCPSETTLAENPELLQTDLMPHQKYALSWLMWRENQYPPGGILADEMGLGKTLTMISLILLDLQHQEDGIKGQDEASEWLSKEMEKKRLIKCKGSLVICPTSLMSQWENEVKKHVRYAGSSVKVCRYHGSNRETNPNRLARNTIVITTYPIIQSELKDLPAESDKDESDSDEEDSSDGESIMAIKAKYKKKRKAKKQKMASPLMQIGWRRIILDEGHCIKNHKSKTAIGCCRIPAGARWIVTGTPVHNKLEEFFSLLKFLRCSPFSEYSVFKSFILPATKQAKANERLKTLVKALVLRRTKTQKCSVTGNDLVSLPKKMWNEYAVSLSQLEQKIYDVLFEASQLYVKEFIKDKEKRDYMGDFTGGSSAIRRGQGSAMRVNKPNPFVTRTKSSATDSISTETGQVVRYSNVLVMLLRLRQAAVHLALIREGVDLGVIAGECEGDDAVVDQLANLTLDGGSCKEERKSGDELDLLNRSGILDSEDFERAFKGTIVSSKVKAILKLIQEIVSKSESKDDSGEVRKEKCVVVSQWVKVLDMIAVQLKAEGLRFTCITGEVELEDRNASVQRFNRPGGVQIMLLSLTAGGVGLNLTGGNHLILTDLHWNPALELQASDRVHRMGQCRPVAIHKFYCSNTIEEKILEIQKQKLQLAQNLLQGVGAKNLSNLSLKDLKHLFELDMPKPSVPLRDRNGGIPDSLHTINSIRQQQT